MRVFRWLAYLGVPLAVVMFRAKLGVGFLPTMFFVALTLAGVMAHRHIRRDDAYDTRLRDAEAQFQRERDALRRARDKLLGQ